LSGTFDAVIVGAGIVGAATAAECARAGLRVLVLDRGSIGGGTTGAAMGHLVVMDDSEAQFALSAYSRRLWQSLAPELPDDVEYHPCGTLWLAADDEELAGVVKKKDFYERNGLRVEILDPRSLSDAEPNLRPGLAGALLVVDDGVLYPPSAARFLLETARTKGAEVRTGVEVRSLGLDGGVTLSNGTRVSAGLSVNAGGCGAPVLTPGLPVRRRKGHLVITSRYPGFVRHQLVEMGYLKSAHSVSADSVAFNVQPRRGGQVLVGSSRQFDAVETSVDREMLERMLRRALEFMPGLGDLWALRSWAGHRPATPDKLPFIGPSLESDKIWLATGHEGLGITTSLATGRLVADMITGRATEIPAEPFAPSRILRKDASHG
jgi:glycine/D-amino acid oxidase-like deaminating enzyme